MTELIGIVLCLFASVGIAQCILWLAGRRKQPKGLRRGYHVLPLYDDPAGLEAQLRYGLSQLDGCRDGCRVVILADMGLGEESGAICDRFVRENPGLLRCRADQLAEAVRDLDRLQMDDGEEMPGGCGA